MYIRGSFWSAFVACVTADTLRSIFVSSYCGSLSRGIFLYTYKCTKSTNDKELEQEKDVLQR